MIALLAPLGLAALAAIAIPVLLHLLRGAHEREITFAALRWLADAERPRTRVRLHERVLLALRVALVAALALVLAMPVWRPEAEPGDAWVVVAPGAAPAAARGVAADVPAVEWRLLAPGFPPLEGASSGEAAPPMTLLRELDASLPADTALTVVVPRELGALDAERPKLAHAVDWRVADGRFPDATTEAPAPAVRRLALRHEDAHDPQVAVVSALADAWRADGVAVTVDAAAADAAVSANTDWLFWLADTPWPAEIDRWIEGGGVALAVAREGAEGRAVIADDAANVVARERVSGAGRVLGLSAPLRPDALPALLEAEFPRRLLDALEGPGPAPGRAFAEGMAPARSAEDVPGPVHALELHAALVAALLFLAERLWATRRRREADA
jgi:hypothetical protein